MLIKQSYITKKTYNKTIKIEGTVLTVPLANYNHTAKLFLKEWDL